jgi:hypothetical protein
MRLWSLHPQYLDPKGLVAVWREALLAQKVLRGLTRGYRHHPQLVRFRATEDPVGAIGVYLVGVADEADRRSYRFNRRKIVRADYTGRIAVTEGQIAYERTHLLGKLKARAPEARATFVEVRPVHAHPLFRVVPGPVADWEAR